VDRVDKLPDDAVVQLRQLASEVVSSSRSQPHNTYPVREAENYGRTLHLGTMTAENNRFRRRFRTPVAPRGARDRVPSILTLGLFLVASDFR
jgi:hypothetical protein